ncbi:helix-turn-helix transcriptional regulator [Natronosporangium hydrolyticum]|uniref:Helix-turn-helix transcriptional regulator n=1 Tax=Natronosporangium hydrolyticum TaxID=2811111 RepID=A0A895YPL8_9ACTN|nr:LuxR C-terminal-related transcriptional regulator [Natronosporangium hydrolyticum]QSB16676.1 helix-turn-helix transcriptional regulator [Natronosporangium hydrolyticum]
MLSQLPEPLVLVLDNVDCLHDRRVLHNVEVLLRYASARLRLVLGARAEPVLQLHRWRLSGELTELRMPELRFTATEAAELMAHQGLSMPDTRVAALADHLEGWPAGLRLASLSMRQRVDLAGATGFGGDDQRVGDYLSDEVLATQPADIRDAMVSASILEWLCGDLVDALTGRDDGENMLSVLLHTNAFVIPRATHPPTYRFHRTFGEFLSGELRRHGASFGAELHHRAAGWLAGNGLPDHALPHMLAADDWPGAVDLFLTHWRELVCRVQHPGGGTLARPPPAAAVQSDPELALGYAAECLRVRELEAADGYLQIAGRQQPLMAGDRRDRFAIMAAALRLARTQLGGSPARLMSAAAELLALVRPADTDTSPADVGARAVALAALGRAQLDAGELDLAEASLTMAMASAERARLSCLPALCSSRLALVRALRGELVAAAGTARVALELPPCPGQPEGVHCAAAYLATAIVDIHQDRPAEAEPHLEAAASLCDPEIEPELAAIVAAVRGQLCQQRGDLAAAYAAVLAGRRVLTERPLSPHVRHRLAITEAEVRTAHGDTGAVQQLLEPLLPVTGSTQVELRVAIARSYLNDGDPGRATSILPVWDGEQAETTPLPVRIEAGLIHALAARQHGDRQRCSWVLEAVLRLAEPEGFRRAFTSAGPDTRALLAGHLDSGTAYWSMVSELLAASQPPEDQPGDFPALDEPLTQRELTVLRYLQSILSTGEIARELHLSINTVKTHLRNIYRKLGTTRRREAVRRARDLRLL